MLMPLLVAAGYSQKSALGLLAGAGSLGGLLPPGLPLVLYALVAKLPIEDMFLAGIIPGLLMVALVGAWGLRLAPRRSAPRAPRDWREARAALLAAEWEPAPPPVGFAAPLRCLAPPGRAGARTPVYPPLREGFRR